MQYRFFYVGPRDVILLLQDGFRRAQEAKLTDEKLASYDIVPGLAGQNRLNSSKFAKFVKDLWRERDRAIVFYDPEYDKAQHEDLLEQLKTSGVTVYALRRPTSTKEDCDRAAMMMLSTPLWTQAYLRQTLSPDDALTAEYDRVVSERDDLKRRLIACESLKAIGSRTMGEVVAEIKGKHHPHSLVITAVTEKTAKTCRFDDSSVGIRALDAIVEFLKLQANKPDAAPNPKSHFNDRGFQFAPTITGITKDQQGEHYKVVHEGTVYETHMHLKTGDFRLYFCLNGKVAVIGSIGDHLPTAGYDE